VARRVSRSDTTRKKKRVTRERKGCQSGKKGPGAVSGRMQKECGRKDERGGQNLYGSGTSGGQIAKIYIFNKGRYNKRGNTMSVGITEHDSY